jgi:hypothetical protein
MPQKSNNPSDPNQHADSPIPQDQNDELEMADTDEDFEDDDVDDEDEADEDEGVEEA